MADNYRSLDYFLHASTGVFKDNTSGDITAQNLRDFALSAYLPHIHAGGRLTTEQGVPVGSHNRTNQGTIYYTPYIHDMIGLYDGTSWKLHQFSELSLSLSSLTPYRLYDVFLYDNAGTLTLELLGWTAPASGTINGATNATPIVIATTAAHGLSAGNVVFISGVGGNTNANCSEGTPWRVMSVSDTTHFAIGTEAGVNRAGNAAYTSGGTWYNANTYPQTRATSITYQDGVPCKSGDLSRRLVGTLMATDVAATRDSYAHRVLANVDNCVPKPLYRVDGASHTIQNIASREWTTYGTRVYFIAPIGRHSVKVVYGARNQGNGVCTFSLSAQGAGTGLLVRTLSNKTMCDAAHNVFMAATGLNHMTVFEDETQNVASTVDSAYIAGEVWV